MNEFDVKGYIPIQKVNYTYGVQNPEEASCALPINPNEYRED